MVDEEPCRCACAAEDCCFERKPISAVAAALAWVFEIDPEAGLLNSEREWLTEEPDVMLALALADVARAVLYPTRVERGLVESAVAPLGGAGINCFFGVVVAVGGSKKTGF